MANIQPVLKERFESLKEKVALLNRRQQMMDIYLASKNKEIANLEKKYSSLDLCPGKQLPFKYQINIPVFGGSNSPVTGSVNISEDAAFVARRINCSCYISEIETDMFRVGESPDYYFLFLTDFQGRYIPISSRSTYKDWAYCNIPRVTGTENNKFIPGFMDFEWEYTDGNSIYKRQDKPISGDLFARHDQDIFLQTNDYFDKGTTISFTLYPLNLSQIAVYYYTYTLNLTGMAVDEITGIYEIKTNLNLVFSATFDGFKVLDEDKFQPEGKLSKRV